MAKTGIFLANGSILNPNRQYRWNFVLLEDRPYAQHTLASFQWAKDESPLNIAPFGYSQLFILRPYGFHLQYLFTKGRGQNHFSGWKGFHGEGMCRTRPTEKPHFY
jgi:hypothetical protein